MVLGEGSAGIDMETAAADLTKDVALDDGLGLQS